MSDQVAVSYACAKSTMEFLPSSQSALVRSSDCRLVLRSSSVTAMLLKLVYILFHAWRTSPTSTRLSYDSMVCSIEAIVYQQNSGDSARYMKIPLAAPATNLAISRAATGIFSSIFISPQYAKIKIIIIFNAFRSKHAFFIAHIMPDCHKFH